MRVEKETKLLPIEFICTSHNRVENLTPLKFKVKVQNHNTFPRTRLKVEITFLRTALKFKVKVHPCSCCMFCVLKFAPLMQYSHSAATQQAKYLRSPSSTYSWSIGHILEHEFLSYTA